MNTAAWSAILTPLHLFFAGLLAGEEFVICFGIRGAFHSLDDGPHIRLRQALIRRLRALVPVVFVLALLASAAIAVLETGRGASPMLRYAGLLALCAFIATTLAGTVPINKAALAWDPLAPPPDWRDRVGRWERLDVLRTIAALAAFAFFLIAATWR